MNELHDELLTLEPTEEDLALAHSGFHSLLSVVCA